MANPIPEGLHSLTAQLRVDGAAEAMEFYKKALGAVETARVPDPSGKKIWHGAMKIGNSQFFINDHFPEMGGTATKASLWIYSGEVDAAWKRATDAGMTVKMPIADMFWGDRTGTVADKWGNQWTLGQHTKDMTREEMDKAGAEMVAAMKAKK